MTAPSHRGDNGSIDDFIVFLCRLTHKSPDQLERQGGSSQDIMRFADLVKLPMQGEAEDGSPEVYFRQPSIELPPLYREYLRTFGLDDGVINLGDDCIYHLDGLIELYESQREIDYWNIPRKCIVISHGGLTTGKAIYFGTGTEEPLVVEHENGKIKQPVSNSFRHFLYQHTWINTRFPQVPRSHVAIALPARLPMNLLATISSTLGFESTWFSDSYGYYGESNTAVVTFFHDQNDTILQLRAEDRRRQDELLASFRAKLES